MDNLEKLIDLHFNGQIKLGISEKIKRQDYDIQYRKVIDDYYFTCEREGKGAIYPSSDGWFFK